jgi:hypothetical protein
MALMLSGVVVTIYWGRFGLAGDICRVTIGLAKFLAELRDVGCRQWGGNRMDFLFELIIELVLQLVIEGLTELGLHSIGEAFHNREKRNPYFAATGYLLLGLISGFVSLLVFPHSFIRSTRFHGISLVTMPLLGGAMMSGIGMLRRRRGQELIQLDTFACGALFGLGMSLIRFLFTH